MAVRADWGSGRRPAMSDHDKKIPAIYVPENPALVEVLVNLPGPLRLYEEHARLLVHFVAVKRWQRDLDPDGYARLSAGILRQYIPARVLTPLKDHLEGIGVLETAGWSSGRFTAGYRIGSAFDGPPARYLLRDLRLTAKVMAWRASFMACLGVADQELSEVIERRRVVLAHFSKCLGRLGLAGTCWAVAAAAANEGADLHHCLYVAQVIGHGDDGSVIVDPFGWRVHTILTRTAKAVRRRLLLDGVPVAEVDVACAQPLLLACLLLGGQV
jgi:hypothetical protein